MELCRLRLEELGGCVSDLPGRIFIEGRGIDGAYIVRFENFVNHGCLGAQCVAGGGLGGNYVGGVMWRLDRIGQNRTLPDSFEIFISEY